jgi:hypothetical protein
MMKLEGKRTYITALAMALASFALAMDWLSREQYQVIIGLMGSLGLAALRSGVARDSGDKIREAGPEAAADFAPGAKSPAGCGAGGNG